MSSPSLATRAGLAVALMVGFYALALAMAGGLLWLVYAQVVYLEQVNLKLSLFGLVGAGAILWAILPRIDRFTAPGPALTRERHPRLFEMLESVAADTGQAMPADVFLIADLNAWVSQRGGVMAVGSRRVMGLGLPLLQALSVDELRAVIAHEFGHYHGGDTALGPWIHKTRAAIGRTLHHLGEHASLLAHPFRWYGMAFLRITHAVSRQQEYSADALAARVTGADTMKRALRTIHGAGEAFGAYWGSEFIPALGRGFRPPFAAGFLGFLAAPAVAEVVSRKVEQEMADGRADPYDTHPSLRERLSALDHLSGTGGRAGDDRPALALLSEPDAAEAELVNHLLRDDVKGTLAPLDWQDAGETLWLPLWREQTGRSAADLATLTPESLPGLAKELPRLAAGLGLARTPGEANGESIGYAMHLVGAALAILLRERGFTIHALPGHPVRLERGDVSLMPFAVMGALASDTLSADEWRAQCAAMGISGVPLARATEGVAPPADASPISGERPPRGVAGPTAQ